MLTANYCCRQLRSRKAVSSLMTVREKGGRGNRRSKPKTGERYFFIIFSLSSDSIIYLLLLPLGYHIFISDLCIRVISLHPCTRDAIHSIDRIAWSTSEIESEQNMLCGYSTFLALTLPSLHTMVLLWFINVCLLIDNVCLFVSSCWPTRDHIGRSTRNSNQVMTFPQVVPRVVQTTGSVYPNCPLCINTEPTITSIGRPIKSSQI